jgi:hypothetical protein
MAKCVSCGADTRPGEVFCEACYRAISGSRAQATSIPEGPRETKTEDIEIPSKEQAKKPPVPLVRKELTPPSKKRVIARGSAILSSGPRKKTKRVSSASSKAMAEVWTGLKRVRKNKAVKIILAPFILLIKLFAATIRWIKNMAQNRGREWDRLDLAAWIAGTIFTIALLLTLIFIQILRFEWTTSAQPVKESASIKGPNFGTNGIVLIVLAATMLAIYLFAATGLRNRTPVDYGFLLLTICIGVMIVFLLTIGSDGNILRGATRARGFPPQYFSMSELLYGNKKLLPGAYLVGLLTVGIFFCSAARLAERKTEKKGYSRNRERRERAFE